jgi:hypothetical protein
MGGTWIKPKGKSMKFRLLVLCGALLICANGIAQDVDPQVRQMKSAYASSGGIALLDDHTLLIQPNMPGPICALPRTKDGKTDWSFFAFPLATIKVPLGTVDEDLISEDMVFTRPDATESYKPGDMGDATMVVVMGVPGKRFHAVTYDREKLARLGSGPHSGASYGQSEDDVEAFGLTFPDQAAARAFILALRNAVTMVKTQAAKR